MSARKKRTTKINLLPQEEFAVSTMGRVLRWLLSTFRYLVITTEMIVIIAFISRFYFDSRTTDLDDEIKQKQQVIASYEDLEEDFRNAQLKLSIFENLTGNSSKTSAFLEEISSKLPNDIQLYRLSFNNDNTMNVEAASISEQSISQLIKALENSQLLENVTLVSIESKADSIFLFFTLRADITI